MGLHWANGFLEKGRARVCSVQCWLSGAGAILKSQHLVTRIKTSLLEGRSRTPSCQAIGAVSKDMIEGSGTLVGL